MKGHSRFTAFRRRAIIFAGSTLLVSGAFYFSTASAKTGAAQPLNLNRPQTVTPGKFAYVGSSSIFGNTNYSIGVANGDGSNQGWISGSTSYISGPTWSPNGAQIAFARNSSTTDIIAINADGSNERNLTNTAGIHEVHPSWSINGKIAYERNGQIWVMNADGTGQVQFPGITQPTATQPAWEADGTKLAFLSGGEIWKINSDGTGERQVTMNATTDSNPAWSPDGLKIAFSKGGNRIAVVNADGTNEMTVTNGQSDYSPAWSTDGGTIAYRASGYGIRRIDPNGANPVTIIPDNIGGNIVIQAFDPSFQPVIRQRPVTFDFDGDRKADISIFRPSNGQWWIDRTTAGVYAATFGGVNDRITPGELTGDGKTDISFWRPSPSTWFIFRSEDHSYFSFPYGLEGDIPIVRDFDGDNIEDPAIFRPSNGRWYVRRSIDGVTTMQVFGTNGDVPVPADYDGDGKADIAVFRPSNGQWWIQRSTAGAVAFTFGNSLDRPVPGDYTGDGRADVAFWRPSTGEWFVMRSENSSFYSFPLGIPTDLPAPGDYDGDGKFDATIFRASNARWYVQTSTGRTLIHTFGQTGDHPVPNAFVP